MVLFFWKLSDKQNIIQNCLLRNIMGAFLERIINFVDWNLFSFFLFLSSLLWTPTSCEICNIWSNPRVERERESARKSMGSHPFYSDMRERERGRKSIGSHPFYSDIRIRLALFCVNIFKKWSPQKLNLSRFEKWSHGSLILLSRFKVAAVFRVPHGLGQAKWQSLVPSYPII